MTVPDVLHNDRWLIISACGAITHYGKNPLQKGTADMAEQKQEFGTKFNQPVTVGRIVHYVLSEGQVRPAIITRVWRDILEGHEHSGMSNLNVFLDAGDDARERQHRGSVMFDEDGKVNTWHWPPRV